MRRSFVSIYRMIPLILILSGIAAIVGGLSGDLLGFGGGQGIGLKQTLLAASGMAALVFGAFLALPVGQRGLARFSSAEGHQIPVLLLATGYGLLAGLVEAAILLYRRVIEGRVINASLHVAWMTPLGEMLVFLSPGILLWIIERLRRRPLPLHLKAGLFSFLAALAVLFLFPRLHLYAVLALAAGVAVQISGLAARQEGRFLALVRLSLPGMALLTGMLGVGVYGWQTLEERQATAALPTPVPGAQNVLLVVLDTVRAQNMSLYGYARPTSPNLDRLAREGVWFERAYATAPWTLPSHGSFFTGLWHYEQGGNFDQPLQMKSLNLARYFASQGYATAGFVANTYYGSYEHGLNDGFAHYEDYTLGPLQALFSSSMARMAHKTWQRYMGQDRLSLPKTAQDVNEDFFDWYSQNNDRPFFAFLNYIDAHGPYLVPKPFERLFGDPSRRANPLAKPRWEWSPQEIQAEVDAYDGTISYVDEQVGQLYAQLKQQGLLENTLVVILSDHGEQFGEHELYDHANSLYIQALHVPLVILFPGNLPAGQKITSPVSLRDIPTTIVDLLQAENTNPFPGSSLARYWQDGEAVAQAEDLILSELFYYADQERPSWYPIGQGNMKSVIDENHHYILNGDEREELYDLLVDPQEATDLATMQSSGRELEQGRKEIQDIIARRAER